MGVPAGITIAFPGAVANIPPGWTRVASLNARHTRGADAGVGGGATGGSNSHSHGSDPHAHSSGGLHTHPVTTPSSSGVVEGPVRSPNIGSGITSVGTTHIHTVSGVPSATDSAGAATSDWSQITIEPPYYTMIWIQSDGTPTGIPAGCIVWWNNSTTPAGFTQHTASGGMYLKGAIAGRGGSSNGGSLISHQHAPTDHVHPMAGHNHGSGAADPTGSSFPGQVNIPSTSPMSLGNHSHVYTISAGTDEPRNSTGMTSFTNNGAIILDPPYIVLQAIVPVVSSAIIGIIALWNGSLGTIPAGWTLCNGAGGTPDCRGRFIRSSSSGYTAGTTGGADTHTHAPPAAHNHNDNAHLHTIAYGAASGSTFGDRDQVVSSSPDGHTHFGAFTDPATATLVSTAHDILSANNRPPYTDVLYVQLTTILAITPTTPSISQIFPNDTPIFTWTIGGAPTQSAYRVLIYASNGTTLVYDSGQVNSATQSATIPVNYLHNHQSYYAQIGATDSAGHFGLSTLVQFSIQMTQPPAFALTATTEPADSPPNVLLQWTPPTIPVGDTFDFYTVERRVTGTTPWISIAQINTYATVSYRDYTGAPNVSYDYAITYTDTRTGDQVASLEQSPPPSATLSFIGIWIHVVQNPAIWLEYQANAEKLQPTQDQKIIPIWGRTRPTAHIGELFYEGLQFTGAPEFYPTTTWQAGLEQFVTATAAGQVLCVRMGQMQEVYFCVLDIANTSRADELAIYANSLAFTEINYEGAILQL